MQKNITIAFTFCMCLLSSCEEVFFKPEPQNDPESNFDVFWNNYDKYYSFFELKNLNWDSVYEANRPLVSPTTTPNQLFDVLKGMVLYLEDGHAGFCNEYGNCVYFSPSSGYHTNRLNSVNSYVSLSSNSNCITSGIINNEIGYINIRSFGYNESDYLVIDPILKNFKQKGLKGLIIDVRGNGGGSDLFSRLIANRFVNQKTVYSYYRYKSGPGHSEFGPWIEIEIAPEGENYYKPTIVLTNREVYSSAEDFILAMRAIPTVTILGDTTGGGSGNPLVRTLPNGWKFRVPRWQQADAKKHFYEGIGIFPDIPIWISKTDSIAGRDTILEKALFELTK